MNELQTVKVDTKENDGRASKALTWANDLTITNQAEYQAADRNCKALYTLRKAIEADFADSLSKADEAKKAATAAKAALVDQIDSHVKPVQEAERIVKGKMLVWSKAEDEKRRQEQDRLRAEATKKAEDEKLKKAAALEASGKNQQAMAELAKPVKVAPIVVPPAPVQRETVIAEYWHYDITEASAVKRDFCKPDPGQIQAAVNFYKKQGKTIEEAEALVGGIHIEARAK
jgi:hypothetical protein